MEISHGKRVRSLININNMILILSQIVISKTSPKQVLNKGKKLELAQKPEHISQTEGDGENSQGELLNGAETAQRVSFRQLLIKILKLTLFHNRSSVIQKKKQE